jgi:hypothetical protein
VFAVIFGVDQQIVDVGENVGEVMNDNLHQPLERSGHPNRPIGDAFHSNCPKPGKVKVVSFRHSGFNIICQNPEVKSMVEKIEDPILPILSMHSWTSLIDYLSTCMF